MASGETELPNITELFGQFLQRVAPEHAPLLVAIAERLAASRYRSWAGEVVDPSNAPGLLACADREEEIARRVEALFPGAAQIQDDIRAQNRNLEEVNRSIFAGRPLAQQFMIQATGERIGAATWRALAERAESEVARETFLACALLEEENAVFLEALRG